MRRGMRLGHRPGRGDPGRPRVENRTRRTETTHETRRQRHRKRKLRPPRARARQPEAAARAAPGASGSARTARFYAVQRPCRHTGKSHRRAVPCARRIGYAPRPPSKERRKKSGHTGAPCAVRRHWPCAVYRARMMAPGERPHGEGATARCRSSAFGARSVVFWGEQRNMGGGAVALRAERAGGRV